MTTYRNEGLYRALVRMWRDDLKITTVGGLGYVAAYTDRDMRDDRVRQATGIELGILLAARDNDDLRPDLIIGSHPNGDAIQLRDLTEAVMVYVEYIRSREWSERARQAKRDAQYVCQCCGRRDVPLEAHHKNYRRLGHELPEDILVLCEDCHRRLHPRFSLPGPQMLLPFTSKTPSGSENN